jgi:O-antigen/teichoic acid export membrane protein
MQHIFLKVGHNTGILLLVNLVNALMGFLMAAALGRNLGDAGFGQYSFVMTWLLSLILLAEFGLSTVLTRDIAAQPEQTHGYLVNSIVGKSLLSLPAALVLLLFTPQLAPNQDPVVIPGLRWGILFLYTGLVYSSFTAIFRAHQVMTPILWLALGGQILLLLGTLALLLAEQPLFLIIAWAGFSQLLQCGLAFAFYQRLSWPGRSLEKSTWKVEGAVIKMLLRKAWPFALAGLLAGLQLRANSLVLAYLQGDQALGWYAAANRFVETGKQLPAAFYSAMLPALAALASSSNSAQRDRLRQTLTQARLGLLAFGGLASLGALLLAQLILTLTYGPAYRPATLPLQLLTLTLIPNGQNSLLIIFLYACGDEKFVNWLTALGTAINLSLCFWLIPTWGATGTALALLISECMLYLPYRQRVKYHQR